MLRIKVAHVIGILAIGGVEKRLLSLIKKQIKSDCITSILVVYFKDGNLTKEFTNLKSNKLHFVKAEGNHFYRIFKIASLLKYVDILHLYNFSGVFSGNIAALVSPRRVKVISHYGGVSSLFSKLSLFVEKYCLIRTDKFIYNSNSTMCLFEYHSLYRKHSEVIMNGIDINISPKNKSIEEGEQIRFVSVGRLTKNKNIESNIKIIIGLLKLGVDCRYDVVGGGENFNYIQGLIKRYDLGKYVILHGFIDNPTETCLFLNCHFLFCCSYSETFGLSVVEGMSKGIVPIVSSVGGLTEVIDHGRAGILLNAVGNVDKKDLIQIPVKKVWNSYYSKVVDIKNINATESSSLIFEVIRDNSVYESFSTAAMEFVREFTIEKYSENILDLYKRVLNK